MTIPLGGDRGDSRAAVCGRGTRPGTSSPGCRAAACSSPVTWSRRRPRSTPGTPTTGTGRRDPGCGGGVRRRRLSAAAARCARPSRRRRRDRTDPRFPHHHALRRSARVHRGGTLAEAFEAAHAALAPEFGRWPIFEHCLPFDVQRVWDELDGVDSRGSGPPTATARSGPSCRAERCRRSSWSAPARSGSRWPAALARLGVPVDRPGGRWPAARREGPRRCACSGKTLEVWARLGVGEQVAARGTHWTLGRTYYRDREALPHPAAGRPGRPLPAVRQRVPVRGGGAAAGPGRGALGHRPLGTAGDRAEPARRRGAAGHRGRPGRGPVRRRRGRVPLGRPGPARRGLPGALLRRPLPHRLCAGPTCPSRGSGGSSSTRRSTPGGPCWCTRSRTRCGGSTGRSRRTWTPWPSGRPARWTGGSARSSGDCDYELVWLTAYRFAQRLAGRFRVGPGFLAGDAAHVMSPFGARGLPPGWPTRRTWPGSSPGSGRARAGRAAGHVRGGAAGRRGGEPRGDPTRRCASWCRPRRCAAGSATRCCAAACGCRPCAAG